MGITKRLSLNNIFIFLFLILFPFGQIIRLSFNFSGFQIPLHPIDIVIVLGALAAIIRRCKKPEVFKHFDNFLFVASFTYLLSIFIFNTSTVLYGLFYLIRLAGYFYFLIYIWNFVSQKKVNRELLLNSLLAVSVISAIFGWIQFFVVPDIKPFFTYGWDEHLYRLVGTFLDPTFLGLIIVFGLITSVFRIMVDKNKKIYLFITIFLIVSLAFTYSRASYLAFFAGVLTIGIFQKKFKELLFLFLSLVLLIVFLPTKYNHSIEFFRSFSILSRVENYSQAIGVFKTSPLFGVGFNNMCLARQLNIGYESFASHACSGSDSSLLLVLATVGMVGFMSFLTLVSKTVESVKNSGGRKLFIASGVTLLVHSTFSNSIFYPWILGYMLILLSVALASFTKR